MSNDKGIESDISAQASARRDAWVSDELLGSKTPFSFKYDGEVSQMWFAGLTRSVQSQALDAARMQHTLLWSDPKTGLEVRCVAIVYADFPAVEWTVYLKNTGAEATPIISHLQGLDAWLQREKDGEFLLHYMRGDYCAADGYRPYEQALWYNMAVSFAPLGGRGTNSAFPYYNLQMPGGGMFLAVGWPGQWAATFQRDAGRGLHIVAGQELTHLRLAPGEEIRTPLIALLFWDSSAAPEQVGDLDRAQNLWRRWMWAHNVPRTASGKLPTPFLNGCTSGQFDEMIHANDENQKYFLDRHQQEGIQLDHWWMDAGWYPCNGRWPMTGTWEPDLERFPGGLRAISDHARAQGVKTLVWFEPERVAPGTWLYDNRPEWLLTRPDNPEISSWSRTFRLLNLGDPAALQWLTDHVDVLLREQGIDLYRQDFNIDPLDFWRSTDTPERQGMTENLYLQGYLAYWDELRRRYPELVIDSCASGGRRNDLETMRRSVPLHPTDYNYGHLAVKQAFHRALLQWIPYFGSNVVPGDTIDTYVFRSGHGMSVTIGFDLRRSDLDYPLLKDLVGELREVSQYYYGDFYPLTPYTIAETDWMAWQLHRPAEGDGLIEAFRRGQSADGVQCLRLSGLEPAAQYSIAPAGTQQPATMTGAELMGTGLPITIDKLPGSALIFYHKVS